MVRLNDPAVVAAGYASEERLRRRVAAFRARDADGPDITGHAIELVAELAPRRVLEAGCGWGGLAARLRDATGAAVVAVDISPRRMSPFVDNVPAEVPEPFRARRALPLFVADEPR
jgi:SAM-dependent methyltransferase